MLGYKGAILCEMSRINVPVPPGFIVSAEASTEFLSAFPSDLTFSLVEPVSGKHSTSSSSTSTSPATATVQQSSNFGKHFKSELAKQVHELERSTGRLFASSDACSGEASKTGIKVNSPLLLSVRVSTGPIVYGM